MADGGATTTAERIASALAMPIEIESGSVKVTASIGMASYPENATEAVLLVKLADEAMYAAKRSGKNCVGAWKAPKPWFRKNGIHQR